LKNITYAQKLLDLAKTLEFTEIIDGNVHTMEDIKKLDEEKIIIF